MSYFTSPKRNISYTSDLTSIPVSVFVFASKDKYLCDRWHPCFTTFLCWGVECQGSPQTRVEGSLQLVSLSWEVVKMLSGVWLEEVGLWKHAFEMSCAVCLPLRLPLWAFWPPWGEQPCTASPSCHVLPGWEPGANCALWWTPFKLFLSCICPQWQLKLTLCF